MLPQALVAPPFPDEQADTLAEEAEALAPEAPLAASSPAEQAEALAEEGADTLGNEVCPAFRAVKHEVQHPQQDVYEGVIDVSEVSDGEGDEDRQRRIFSQDHRPLPSEPSFGV